jgi:PAS domain S-box-containing protein
MGEFDTARRRNALKIVIITALALLYGALGLYFNAVLGTSVVYTHLAYIPIVLAGVWWGRRSVFVAVILATVIVLLRVFGIGIGELWSDMARGLLFFAVALCVGTLSEKVTAGQRALRVSEEKYRSLIEKSLSGILVYKDDRVVFANPRVSEMLGYDPEELIDKSIWELIHEEDREKVKDLLLGRQTGEVSDLHYECGLVRADGAVIWADIASATVEFDEDTAVLVTAYDVTDRKEAEEKRRQLAELAHKQEEQLVHSTRLAELGEMAAAIAHELNQPLTGIRNFARNAYYMIDQSVGTPDEVKTNLRFVSEQVDRASKIINQMRELTRRSEKEFAPISVNGIIKESIEFLTPQLKLSGVEIALDLAENLPRVMGDRIRLEQVFLNLLTNARQAMEEAEERRLKVKTYVDSDIECPVVVEIEDTGKGFAPEDSEKLFAPFYSTKKPGHGTGLGLSISLTIVRDHKGRVEATSAPGRGAKFTVRLPARPSGEIAETQANDG